MTKEQLIIANIFGTIAILISVLPFMFGVISIYNDVDEKKNYSLAEAIIKIYIVQVVIAFIFMVFVTFWDILAKKETYKLVGSGKAFDIFWGDCKAGMDGATEESIKAMYAYQCLIMPVFQSFLAYSVFLMPFILFFVSFFKISKTKNGYIEGEDTFKNIFRSFVFTFIGMLLIYTYLEIINNSLYYQGGEGTIFEMIRTYWKDLLTK
ncbi:MAG: hypothetical protein M0R46_09895 [Candidatus Muirbacterium halophilum]|nr:hypothetical protein [Candidatus Muirbacterium halophilum]